MTCNTRLFFLVVDLVVAYTLLIRQASAEFLCQAKVGYTVEFSDSENSPQAADSGATPAKSETKTLESNTSTVYLVSLEAKGEDQEKAKAALQKSSLPQIEKVKNECRVRHENVAACIASKFNSNANVLPGLSFSARKSLEQAINKDCEAQRGMCKKTELSEPVCSEIVVAAPAAESPAADAAADKKKAKK